ncbi:MAG: hypothetical protein NTW20_03780 [Rhodobacterales bacterium]|nr:hypothetical protein [Rhodobacterales bacterium]
MMIDDSWPEYLGHCRKMVDAVSEAWPRGDSDYQPIGSGFLELADDANATVREVLDLYDKLLAEKPDAHLLLQIAQPRKAPDRADHRIEKVFGRHLGHSNPNFPLMEHQRQVMVGWTRCRPEK